MVVPCRRGISFVSALMVADAWVRGGAVVVGVRGDGRNGQAGPLGIYNWDVGADAVSCAQSAWVTGGRSSGCAGVAAE